MSEFKDPKNFAIAQFNFCWVIALRAEAIPIIEAFKMKILDNQSLFPIYANETTGHALIISGVGSIKSAAAATFLKNYLQIKNYTAWINLGIAGLLQRSNWRHISSCKSRITESGAVFFPGLRLSKLFAG